TTKLLDRVGQPVCFHGRRRRGLRAGRGRAAPVPGRAAGRAPAAGAAQPGPGGVSVWSAGRRPGDETPPHGPGVAPVATAGGPRPNRQDLAHAPLPRDRKRRTPHECRDLCQTQSVPQGTGRRRLTVTVVKFARGAQTSRRKTLTRTASG